MVNSPWSNGAVRLKRISWLRISRTPLATLPNAPMPSWERGVIRLFERGVIRPFDSSLPVLEIIVYSNPSGRANHSCPPSLSDVVGNTGP